MVSKFNLKKGCWLSYVLLGGATANSLLRTLLLQWIDGKKNVNSDIVALAEETLKLGNVGIDGECSFLRQLLGGLCVAAVDLAVLSAAGITAPTGHVGGTGDGESGKSEDEDLGEHLE